MERFFGFDSFPNYSSLSHVDMSLFQRQSNENLQKKITFQLILYDRS